MQSLRILVVEDDAIVANDLGNCLSELGHHPLGPAFNLAQAKELIESTDPQLALLDIHLEKPMDGIDLAEWMLIHKPVPVVFLTAFADEITLQRAMATHPAQYLVKPFDKVRLKVAVEIAGNNFYQLNAEHQLSRKLYKFNNMLSCPLSQRELEVVKFLARGLSNRDLSEQLFLSEHTIKSHLKNIFLKTGASSRADLICRVNQL